MEILGNICFSEQIFYRKQAVGAPEQYDRADYVTCVAIVSNRVMARKLEREPKKKKKGGRGRWKGEEETLARKPCDPGKRPLIFHGSVHF